MCDGQKVGSPQEENRIKTGSQVDKQTLAKSPSLRPAVLLGNLKIYIGFEAIHDKLCSYKLKLTQ